MFQKPQTDNIATCEKKTPSRQNKMQNHISKVQIQKKAFTRSWASRFPGKEAFVHKEWIFCPRNCIFNFKTRMGIVFCTAGKSDPQRLISKHMTCIHQVMASLRQGILLSGGFHIFLVVQSLAFFKSKVAGKIQN